MRLILLRHAKSSWTESGLSDHDRPLAKRGFNDAPNMGARLANRGVHPGLILTSSALRARQTAALAASAWDPHEIKIAVDPAIYLATPGQMLAVIAKQSDSVQELLLIGHNPGMTQLANAMLPSLSLQNLPTAGAVAIDCDVEHWADIESAAYMLAFYDYPKNPESPV
ncbi:MAG: histidine phosphatase family protein [Gammaproteobacteria bacterium]|nr:histidine phosphatase family protein [Gammaproteobacteria bacterium]